MDVPSHAAAENIDEVPYESWNIFPAFAEGWQGDRKDIEPIIEVTRNSLRATISARSRFVAATRRTST